jgi:hypothetical protein
MSGADIHTIAQLLGHKDFADAVGKLDEIFGEACRYSVTSRRA